MFERKILWESMHLSMHEKSEKQRILDNTNPDDLDDDELEVYEELQNMPEVLDTPMGYILKDDSMNPLTRIEHRICHTNFTIGERELTRVNFIDGVETLTAISRYQMVVGFGRMFDAEKVREDIRQKLVDMTTYTEEDFHEHLLHLEKST